VTTNVIFLDNDNNVSLTLTADGSAYTALSSATRIVLELNGQTYDSDSLGLGANLSDAFDVSTGSGILLIRPKDFTGLTVGEKYLDGRIIVYDATYTDGLVFPNGPDALAFYVR
jgi:hypothetical protein